MYAGISYPEHIPYYFFTILRIIDTVNNPMIPKPIFNLGMPECKIDFNFYKDFEVTP